MITLKMVRWLLFEFYVLLIVNIYNILVWIIVCVTKDNICSWNNTDQTTNVHDADNESYTIGE